MQPVMDNKDLLIKQGQVKRYQDIYPDVYKRIRSRKSVAYIRGSVSIKLMCLLYDVVIVHIPPISKEQIEKRFHLEWDELIKLCQNGLVIPIIENSEFYTSDHFDRLFKDTSPYSLWARGIALLDIFNMSNTLEIGKRIGLTKKISTDSGIYKKWTAEYGERWIASNGNEKEDVIKQKIIDDIAVQYADLCIFGCKNEAEKLLVLEPLDLYNNLRLLNEVRTYPILFGLESQANFDKEKLLSTSSLLQLNSKSYVPQVIPENELEILYRGIGIEVEDVCVEAIIEYHNDGLGEKIRAALSSFNSYCDKKIRHSEKLNMGTVYERAEDFQKKLESATQDLHDKDTYKKMDKCINITKPVLKIGAIAAGTALGVFSGLNQELSIPALAATGGLSLSVSLIDSFPEAVAEVLVKSSNPRFVANMWSAKKIVDGRSKR